MEKDKIDFDAPAFVKTAEAETGSEKTTTEVSQTESGENKEQGTSGPEPVVEEQKVPYSRMKTVLDRARDAEREAEEANERYQELLQKRERSSSTTDHYEPEKFTGNLPSYWVKLFGDSESSREAYGLEQDRIAKIEERAEQRALEAIDKRYENENRAIAQNERVLDNRLEDFSMALGRDLTETEQSALLDIVDEYTPTGEDGKYLGELIPFEKAWEVYQLRQGTQQNSARERRGTATSLTSSRSEGEPTSQEKRNETFNPLDWNSYRRRI